MNWILYVGTVIYRNSGLKTVSIYNIIVSRNVDQGILIPKMTIQTFVENAIKHGFESRKGGGNVDIIIQMIEDKLEILIRDNGIGRSQAALQRTVEQDTDLRYLTIFLKS